MKPAVLYVSYDGVLEPLGESQVVSYLEKLARDHAITLLTFEKPSDWMESGRVEAMRARLHACGITWVPLPYHKRPPVLSTVWDVFAGIARARRIVRRWNVKIVHARGYVPSLIALAARRVTGAAFLFDMRGFWVDEKVEAGHWPAGGVLYRVGKWWERRFYAAADAVVSLTHAGVRAMPELGVSPRAHVPIEVIPTCADLGRFSPAEKDAVLAAQLGVAGAPVIGCVGTMGNWYLRQEMIDWLAALTGRWPELRCLIVTRDDHETLRRDLLAAGVPFERLSIVSATFAEMPRYMRLFDAGLFFIKPTFAKRASAATKMAEFLGCGVPVVINDGVGDSGAIVNDGNIGVVLPSLDLASCDDVVARIRALVADRSVSERCRRVAVEIFDLDAGVETYRQLYGRLLGASERH